MKSEIAKVINGIEIKIALFIGILLVIIQAPNSKSYVERITALNKYSYLEPETSFLQVWIGQDRLTGCGDLFYLVLFPMLAAIPFAASHFREKKLGYDKLVISKIGRKKYFFNKYLVAFISGGIVVFIPPIISMLWSLTCYPVVPLRSYAQTTVVRGDFLWTYFYNKPVMYVLLFGVMNFVVGGSLAAAALSLTYYVESSFQLMILPMLINLILPDVFNVLPGALSGITRYFPYAYVSPMPIASVGLRHIATSVLVINLFSGLLYFINTRRDVL